MKLTEVQEDDLPYALDSCEWEKNYVYDRI